MDSFIKQFWHTSEVQLIEEVNKYAKDNNLDILNFTFSKATHSCEILVLFKKKIIVSVRNDH